MSADSWVKSCHRYRGWSGRKGSMGFDNTSQDADLARMAKTTDGALLVG
jgi:hypothetical protein